MDNKYRDLEDLQKRVNDPLNEDYRRSEQAAKDFNEQQKKAASGSQ